MSAIPRDLDLALPRADGLHEHDVLARRVEQENRLQRRLGEPAEMPARPHRADVDARVEEVIGEPDAVAEERAVRERARRIDRDDADRPLALAECATSAAIRLDLPDPGRAGDADDAGPAGLRIELPDERIRERSPSSTSEIARASARRSPARTPATSSSSVNSLSRHVGTLCGAMRFAALRASRRASISSRQRSRCARAAARACRSCTSSSGSARDRDDRCASAATADSELASIASSLVLPTRPAASAS